MSYACNLPPEAFISDCPKYVPPDGIVCFSGLYSTDHDGYIVDYQWTFQGPAYDIIYVDPWEVGCKFSAPGIYTVNLEVTDDDGATDNFECTVNVIKMDLSIIGAPGGYIALNTDDDNKNSKQDLSEYETVAYENDLVEIELSMEPEIGGLTKLQISTFEGTISVWGDQNKSISVINPHDPVDPTTEADCDLSEGPQTLWVEACRVHNTFPYGILVLSYIHPTMGHMVHWDWVRFKPVEVRLFMDGVNEDNEEFPGNYILYNKDDDNNNGVPDYEDPGSPAEDDLVKIIPHWVEPSACWITPDYCLSGQVTFDISSGDTKVKVWTSATKGIEVSLPQTYATPDDLPKIFYVEGIDPSDGPRDVVFTLTYDNLGPNFVDKVMVTVVEVELFKDSDYTQVLDDWPKSGGLRSPKYIFGEDDPIYVQVKNIGTDPDIEETRYNVVAATSDSGGLIYLDLKETGADTQIFRNSIADNGELLYLSTEDIDDYPVIMDPDKIKVMNEEVLTFWLSIPPIYGAFKRSEDVMVDRGEVAAVDGTPTLDAAEFHGDMLSSHDWFSNGLYDKNHDKNLGDDDKCVELGNKSDIMYIAGHCWSGDDPTRIYAVDNTYGLKERGSSENLQVADVGTWARELDWLILAACSTCKIDFDTMEGPGTEWIGTMDDGGLTHGIMGYQYGAPGGSTPTTDVELADEFVSALNSNTVKNAWIDTNFAHKWATSDYKYSPLYAVAIFRNVNVSDQVGPVSTQNITRDRDEEYWRYYEIYWERLQTPPYVDESSAEKVDWPIAAP